MIRVGRSIFIQMAIITLLLITFLPTMALAAWSTIPTTNNPICTATNNQLKPKLVSDGLGGAIIVWDDYRNGLSNGNIYAHRVDASGSTLWTDNGTAICTAANTQYEPQLVSDGSAGAIITWSDHRSGIDTDIYARRVDASGNTLWIGNGTPICTAANYQDVPLLVSDGSGGAIIIWTDYRSGSDYDIYAQRVDASGSTLWTGNGIPICTATNNQTNAQLVSDGSGGAIIVWADQRSGSNYHIYAQRVDASGSTLWTGNGTAICTAANSRYQPQLVSDGLSGAIIAWQDYRSGSDYDIYAQRVDASGSALWTDNGTATCTTANNQYIPQLVSDSLGGAIIVWQDYRSGSDYDVYAQRMDASGSALWTDNGTAICTATSDQEYPQLVSDGLGGDIIAWQDYRSGSDYDVYAQRVDASGSALWTDNGTAICTATNDQEYPHLVSDGSGGAIIAWQDQRSGNFDIYAQLVNSLGSLGTPPDISVSPTMINFSPVAVGSQSPPEVVTITNEGSNDLTITTISITGADSSQFTIVSDNTSLNTLALGVSANVSVNFKPTSTGVKAASLSIPSNDPDENPFQVSLSGEGTAPPAPDIAVSPASIDFGSVQSGSQSPPEVITITNEGLADLTISTTSITGADSSQFAIVSDNISLKTLASSVSANVSVSFKPTSAGAKAANLSIPSDDPDEAMVIVSLSGSSPSPTPPPSGGGGGGGGGVTKNARITFLGDVTRTSGELIDYVEAPSLDSKLKLSIPIGTFARNRNDVALRSIRITTLAEAPEVSENMEMIGLAYELTPDGANFNPPITLVIEYDTSEIPDGVSEKNLVVATWDELEEKWVECESTVDTETHTISVKIDSFSIYTVIANTHPANFTIADLEINPGEVTQGESVSIGVIITNTGDLTGSYQVTLKIDNEAISTEDVELAGRASQTVTFTTTRDIDGTYVVTVNDLSGTFVVETALIPAIFDTSDLTISPIDVDIGESVTISVLVTNTGDLTGSYQVTLKIDNEAISTEDVELAGRASQTVTFTTTKDIAGTYAVTVNDLSGTFTVKAAPVPTAVPSKPANWWLIGGIIAALVVAGSASYLFLRKRMKAKTTSS